MSTLPPPDAAGNTPPVVVKPGWRHAYMAGFFDGEGTVSIKRQKRRRFNFVLEVSVHNTSLEALRPFLDHFGGRISKIRQRNPRARVVYRWKIEAAKAEAFLRATLPHLFVKRPQADLALEFRKLFRGENILPRGQHANSNPERGLRVLAGRQDCFFRMKALNRRGKQ